MNRFKKVGKSFTAAVILGTISTLIFFLYMLLVGIPKTQARNYYNLAETILEQRDISVTEKEQAKSYLNRAIEFWPERYIQERLESLD